MRIIQPSPLAAIVHPDHLGRVDAAVSLDDDVLDLLHWQDFILSQAF